MKRPREYWVEIMEWVEDGGESGTCCNDIFAAEWGRASKAIRVIEKKPVTQFVNKVADLIDRLKEENKILPGEIDTVSDMIAAFRIEGEK